jgi:hypothetical protein
MSDLTPDEEEWMNAPMGTPMPDQNTMLKNEIEALICRYSQESDVTVYSVIGALEVIKQNLMDKWKKDCE